MQKKYPKFFIWLKTIPNARYIAVVITALVTALFTQFGKWSLEKKIVELEVEEKRLELRLEQEQSKRISLEIELVKCRADYGFIQSSLDDLPLPAWITDAQTNIVRYVNPAYERIFLSPLGFTKFDLIGNTANHIFGNKLTAQFNDNNNWVVSNRRSLNKKEDVLEADNKIVKWNTVKYPIFEYDRVRAIGGVAYK